MSSNASISQPETSGEKPRLALAISSEERSAFLDGRLDRLKAVAEIVDATSASGPRLEKLHAANAEILVTAWSTPHLELLLDQPGCRLKYVCHLTGSVRNLVPRSFIEQGGCVTNWGAVANPAVAEHALLLALAAMRNLPQWGPVIAGPRNRPATRTLGTQSLTGKRVGIHGFGGVAQALVRLLQPFNVSIQSYSAGVPADVFRAHGVEPAPSLAQLFARSDVLFECEALTAATRGSVSTGMLALLHNDAVFVNIARGDLVDEDALVREAASGRIRVALDVVAAEPLTPASAVSRIKGAVLSPHIAGPTLDQYSAIGELAVANIERYARGAALQAPVTLEIFDRST